jgi:hypothetical protein
MLPFGKPISSSIDKKLEILSIEILIMLYGYASFR